MISRFTHHLPFLSSISAIAHSQVWISGKHHSLEFMLVKNNSDNPNLVMLASKYIVRLQDKSGVIVKIFSTLYIQFLSISTSLPPLLLILLTVLWQITCQKSNPNNFEQALKESEQHQSNSCSVVPPLMW